MLVSWSENVALPLPTYTTTMSRNWRKFDIDTFVHHLEQSELCSPCESVYDLDFMTDRFNIVITGLLNKLAPVKSIIIRERSRQPWYDSALRAARSKTRRLERKFKCDKKVKSRSEWRAALKSSRKLSKVKAASYWQSEINAAAGDSRRQWSNINSLLDEKVRINRTFSDLNYHDMMDSKVSDIRTATASAYDPTYDVSNSPSSLAKFSVDDVLASIASSSSKQCESDPMPIWLLKKCSSILAPYITNILTFRLRQENFLKCGSMQSFCHISRS